MIFRMKEPTLLLTDKQFPTHLQKWYQKALQVQLMENHSR
jgi:hypothetical protein